MTKGIQFATVIGRALQDHLDLPVSSIWVSHAHGSSGGTQHMNTYVQGSLLYGGTEPGVSTINLNPAIPNFAELSQTEPSTTKHANSPSILSTSFSDRESNQSPQCLCSHSLHHKYSTHGHWTNHSNNSTTHLMCHYPPTGWSRLDAREQGLKRWGNDILEQKR